MSVNPSGYYKWLNRLSKENPYEQNRNILTKLLQEEHEKHPSYGYHRLSAVIRNKTGWIFSDNLAHKCCKFAKIQSKARRPKYQKSGSYHKLYPNRVCGNWNAQKPLEIVVSDMTCLPYKGKLYEWTYILDTFNNEILSHALSQKAGDRKPYFSCLTSLKEKITQQHHDTILHTDQGSVYASLAFAKAHENSSIIHSMSRAGTPTDNPIIESVNGWIKEEMKFDFNYQKQESLPKFLDSFVYYFNHQRPAYSLNYKTPVQFKSEQGF